MKKELIRIIKKIAKCGIRYNKKLPCCVIENPEEIADVILEFMSDKDKLSKKEIVCAKDLAEDAVDDLI